MRTDRNCNLEGEKETRGEHSISRGDNCPGQTQKVMGSKGS